MREHSFGVGITFAAMPLILVKAESVIETLWFRLSLGDKAFAITFEKSQLIFRNFEVRHNRATFVFGNHGDVPSLYSLDRDPNPVSRAEDEDVCEHEVTKGDQGVSA